jgi:hypothetical protein
MSISYIVKGKKCGLIIPDLNKVAEILSELIRAKAEIVKVEGL